VDAIEGRRPRFERAEERRPQNPVPRSDDHRGLRLCASLGAARTPHCPKDGSRSRQTASRSGSGAGLAGGKKREVSPRWWRRKGEFETSVEAPERGRAGPGRRRNLRPRPGPEKITASEHDIRGRRGPIGGWKESPTARGSPRDRDGARESRGRAGRGVHEGSHALFRRLCVPECGCRSRARAAPVLSTRRSGVPGMLGTRDRREVSPDLVWADRVFDLEGGHPAVGRASGYVRKVICPSLARKFKAT